MSNVAKVLKLGALYPKHLNLNGDHGNLLVLKKRLEGSGIDVETVAVDDTSSLSSYDFILVGHGSQAAWLDIQARETRFVENVANYISSGGAALVISSAFDLLAMKVFGKSEGVGNHRSEFAETKDGIVGYLNTGSQEKQLIWQNNALFTLLHGPVLAKNPDLADQFIRQLGFEPSTTQSLKIQNVDNLAQQARRIAFEN
jgi:hypothetical protein